MILNAVGGAGGGGAEVKSVTTTVTSSGGSGTLSFTVSGMTSLPSAYSVTYDYNADSTTVSAITYNIISIVNDGSNIVYMYLYSPSSSSVLFKLKTTTTNPLSLSGNTLTVNGGIDGSGYFFGVGKWVLHYTE